MINAGINDLYNIAKRTKSEDDWKVYRSLKNSINS